MYIIIHAVFTMKRIVLRSFILTKLTRCGAACDWFRRPKSWGYLPWHATLAPRLGVLFTDSCFLLLFSCATGISFVHVQVFLIENLTIMKKKCSKRNERNSKLGPGTSTLWLPWPTRKPLEIAVPSLPPFFSARAYFASFNLLQLLCVLIYSN